MRTDIKEKNGETVARQIEFPSDIYFEVDELVGSENRRLKKHGKNKMFIKDLLPVLVADGLRFRKGKVFTPEDMRKDFTKNEKWLKLRAKAELAVEEFMKYQEQLLEK